MKKLPIAFLSILSFSALALPAEDAEVNQRDIEILQSVLVRLVQGDVKSYFPQSRARGSVLEGYGVIFYVPYSFSGITIPAPVKVDSQSVKGVFQMYTTANSGEKADERMAKKVAEIKSSLTTFFGDYAGVLDLPAGERLTVVVEIQDPQIYSVGFQENGGQQLLYASLRGDQLAAAKRGNLNREALAKAIVYSDGKEEGKSFEDLSIFCGILDQAVSGQEGLHLDTIHGTRGVYFPGFGVVFMTSSSASPHVLLSALARSRSSYRVAAEAGLPIEEEAETQEQLEKVKENIIETLARYGGALKTPADDESVLVMVESGMPGLDQGSGRITLKASVKDIRAAYRGDLSLEAFTDKVKIWEP